MTHRALIFATVAALLLAGCGAQSSDKNGGRSGEVRVLRLANANEEPAELEAYAREVKRVSGGRLIIRFVNDYRRGKGDAEPGVIADVRAGRIDLGWVGARAFSADGVRAFDPFIAPFAVTDYDTERRVLDDPVAGTMLAAVDTVGVRGVALLPGPMRRLGMREPWSGPDDLAGKHIGAPAGIGSDAIKALGAVPVVHGSGHELTGLDGDEQHLPSFLGNHYMHKIPYVASQPLWPRPLVVIASDGVDARDREILVKAGTSAVLPMLNAIRAADRTAQAKLCAQGARFFEADGAALRQAVEPVYAAVRRDPVAAKVLASIVRLPKGVEHPLACDAKAPVVEGGLPRGQYTFTFTEADRRSRSAGKAFKDKLPETFRVVITGGHMVMWISERGAPEEVGLEDDFSTFKDRFDVGNGAITGRWKVDGDGNLHFSDIQPSGAGDDFVFATKPWRRLK